MRRPASLNITNKTHALIKFTLCQNVKCYNNWKRLTIWLSLLADTRDDGRSIPECRDQATVTWWHRRTAARMLIPSHSRPASPACSVPVIHQSTTLSQWTTTMHLLTLFSPSVHNLRVSKCKVHFNHSSNLCWIPFMAPATHLGNSSNQAKA